MTVASPISREKILTTARLLPAAPQVMAGLCELLQDVNSDLSQVAEQIRVDAALAARIIRMSNSASFGGAIRLGSVDDAVNRVGFGEVLRLVGIATVAGLAERSLACYGVGAEPLRESLLLHALASETLAREANLEPRLAYTGGLLRAVGIMVLDRIGRDRTVPPQAFDRQKFPSYTEWEVEVFGVESTDVATTVLDEWRFAPELVVAIQSQHLGREGDLADPFACVLNLAGGIVAESGRALPGEAASWTVTPAKLAGAGLSAEQWQAAGVQARALFEQHCAELY